MNQTVKHTPGPWVAASHPSSIVGWPIVAQTGRLICSLATPPKDINRVGAAKIEYDEFMAECGANAHLIAAMPDMLEAAKPIADELGLAEWATPEGAEEILQKLIREFYPSLRAAIAKAEGRT